jgi:hypothetical protein
MSNEQLEFSTEVPDAFRAKVEKVTPAQAAWMLRFNTKNRKVNDRRVEELARLMLAGDFKMNGEAVKLSWGVRPLHDSHGEPMKDPTTGEPLLAPILLDGQHRLEALVLAAKTNPDITVDMLVIRGVDPETQSTMDTGQKRTVGNVFQMSGEKEANVLASMLGNIWKWDAGDRKFATHPKATTVELERMLADPVEGKKLRRSLEVGLQTGRGFNSLSKSALAIAHYILSRVDAKMEYVPYFFHLIATGENLSKGNPVLALRERARRNREGNQRQYMTMSRQVGLIIRAWNNCVKGEAVSTLLQSATEPVPEPVRPNGDVPFLTDANFIAED